MQLEACGGKVAVICETTAGIEHSLEGFEQHLRCPKEPGRLCSVSDSLNYSRQRCQTESDKDLVIELLAENQALPTQRQGTRVAPLRARHPPQVRGAPLQCHVCRLNP